MLRLRPAATSCNISSPAAYIHFSTNEKRRYVITSSLRQFITGNRVANLFRYLIERRVAFASALEYETNSA